MKPNFVGFASIFVLSLTFTFTLLSLAMDYWQVIETSTAASGISVSLRTNEGLWNKCYTYAAIHDTFCEAVETNQSDNQKNFVRLTKGMMFLGLFTATAALLITVINIFWMKDKREMLLTSMGLSAATALFVMIAFAGYTANVRDESSVGSFGAAYGFGITAFLLALISIPLLYVARKR